MVVIPPPIPSLRILLRSLCKAAAVATVVNLVITTLRRISKFGRCGNVLLHWLRGAVNYALTYAICFISIYGLSFSEGK